MKPNFLVIGATKCATTTLCDLFAAHPRMLFARPKKPECFCDNKVFARGRGSHESLFASARGKIAVGEGSTSYTKQMLFPLDQRFNGTSDFLNFGESLLTTTGS